MHPLDLQLTANIHGDFETGWRLSEEMWRQDPTDNRVAFNRGWHVLAHGDLQGGMELIDRGRWISVFGSKPLASIRPMYDPKKHDIRGKTLLFRSEGGLGDEIINVRFVNDFAARGAKVVVSADAGLASVFARMSGVSAVVQPGQELGVYHDYWVPGMSSVRCTGHTYDTLPGEPYLTASPDHVKKWKGVVSAPQGVLKVGIKWSGNPQFEHEQHRRFPAEPIIDLYTIPGVKLFSFQRDDDFKTLPPEITDLRMFLADWEDTAAALSLCDIVISSCTSVAHMSGALGKETWVLPPVLSYYIWAHPEQETSPWYDSVRLFRQKKYGDWTEPLSRIREQLSLRAIQNNRVANA